MDVFVYGTLTDPAVVGRAVDSYAFVGSAVLTGLHPVKGQYPSLAPGGRTGGRLLRTEEVDALDAYEGVEESLYVRLSIPLEGPEGQPRGDVSVYVGDPDRLGVVEEVTWPGDGSFGDRVEQFVRENDVRVRQRQQ
jgi:gamma-glutamylcyclotransferase (GGCT)/AIG2-like uncharacterized protein YtfP